MAIKVKLLPENRILANHRCQNSPRGTKIVSMPRAVMLRTLLLNHSYHHRGQLSVYPRLLDVPVIYGRSADENPFA